VGEGQGEGEKSRKFTKLFITLPFTLLDKVVYSALLFKKSSI
jgi:hypothetical protein